MRTHFIIFIALLCCNFMEAQIVSGSKVRFTYDGSSNNQFTRRLSTSSRESIVEESDSISEEAETLNDLIDIIAALPKKEIENKFSVSPNPTTGEVILKWEEDIATYITDIQLVSLVTSETSKITKTKGNSIGIDLTGKVTGLYLVVFYLDNPNVPAVQKKLIKL